MLVKHFKHWKVSAENSWLTQLSLAPFWLWNLFSFSFFTRLFTLFGSGVFLQLAGCWKSAIPTNLASMSKILDISFLSYNFPKNEKNTFSMWKTWRQIFDEYTPLSLHLPLRYKYKNGFSKECPSILIQK